MWYKRVTMDVKSAIELACNEILYQNCSHQFNLFTSGDYSQPNRHMPGSILGIDNHSVALAIDVAISYIYTNSYMHGPGPFMF